MYMSTIAEPTVGSLLVIACLMESPYAVFDACSKHFHFPVTVPKTEKNIYAYPLITCHRQHGLFDGKPCTRGDDTLELHSLPVAY